MSEFIDRHIIFLCAYMCTAIAFILSKKLPHLSLSSRIFNRHQRAEIFKEEKEGPQPAPVPHARVS